MTAYLLWHQKYRMAMKHHSREVRLYGSLDKFYALKPAAIWILARRFSTTSTGSVFPVLTTMFLPESTPHRRNRFSSCSFNKHHIGAASRNQVKPSTKFLLLPQRPTPTGTSLRCFQSPGLPMIGLRRQPRKRFDATYLYVDFLNQSWTEVGPRCRKYPYSSTKAGNTVVIVCVLKVRRTIS